MNIVSALVLNPAVVLANHAGIIADFIMRVDISQLKAPP